MLKSESGGKKPTKIPEEYLQIKKKKSLFKMAFYSFVTKNTKVLKDNLIIIDNSDSIKPHGSA